MLAMGIAYNWEIHTAEAVNSPKGRRQFIGYVLTVVHEEALKGILETIL